MKRYVTLIAIFCSLFFLIPETKAYTVTSVDSRECNKYEVVTVKQNEIINVGCYETYNEALNIMNSTNIENGVPSIIYGNTYINSKYALINIRTKPSSSYNTYMYSSATSTQSASYINGYYAPDAALLDVYYTESTSTTRALSALSGLKQYISKTEDGNIAYEIVPLTLVKSANKYIIKNGSIMHKIAKEIGNDNSYASSYSLGPAPTYLEENKDYYSYDGIYFYTDLYKLIDDNKQNIHDNSVNKDNPYYNYYQYLPQRTKTNILSSELDAYLRNEGKNLSNSKLYGEAHYFIVAQNTYGINALTSYSISLNESAKGSSNIAMTKNNVFGHAAYDYDPTTNSTAYSSVMYSIYYHADVYMSQGYAYTGDWRYYGSHLGNKASGVNVKYASDPYWGEKATSYYYTIDKKYGLKDYNYYTIGMKTTNSAVNVRSEPNTSSAVVYTIPANKFPTFVIVGEVTGTEYQGSTTWYKILFDSALDGTTPSKKGTYSFSKYVYIHSKTLEKLNDTNEYKNPNTLTTKDTGISYKNSTTEEYHEVQKTTTMYYDPLFTNSTYKTIPASTKVLLKSTAYNDKGDIAYLVKYGDTIEWIESSALKYDDAYNKLISSIKYETFEKPILLKLNSDTKIYTDSVLTSASTLTLKKDTYVIATKLAYTTEKKYSYVITYDITANYTGFIDATKVTQVNTYNIGNNQNNNELNIRSEANTSSSRIGTISVPNTNFVIVSEVTGQSISDNTKWYKIIYNSPNNLTGYISSVFATSTKPSLPSTTVEEPPISEEPEEKPINYTETTGLFDLTSLTYDETSKKFNLIATLKVDNVKLSDSYNVKYDLILKDLNTNKETVIALNEHSYLNTNINANFDLSSVAQGDYSLYVRARVSTYSTTVLLNNVFGRKTIKKITIGTRGYLFRTNFYSNYVPIELSIRNNGNITTLNNPTNDNMFNDYVDISFSNNKLNIRGTSYNVNGNYSKNTQITRQIILENTTTFKRTTYDASYIDNGDYTVTLRVPDNQDKTRSWFDTKLDLSSLEKGTYVIYIRTKTTNIDDYGELTDIFARDLSSKKTTLTNGNKAYLKLNKNVRMRVELVIE